MDDLRIALAANTINNIIEAEREEIEQLEYERRCLEEELDKASSSSTDSGPWTKEDQENFELNWHSHGAFDLDGDKADKPKLNDDFLNFC